jgi:hypothetical protein
MSTTPKNVTGAIAFGATTILVFSLFLLAQTVVAEFLVGRFFQGVELYQGFIPGKWIMMNSLVQSDNYTESLKLRRLDVMDKLKSGEYDPANASANELIGKQVLRDLTRETQGTLYFIDPLLAFAPIYVFVSLVVAFLVSMFLPIGNRSSLIRSSLQKEFDRMEFALRKQCGSHKLEFDRLMSMTGSERENAIRNSTLPEVTVHEMADFTSVREWLAGERGSPFVPMKFYFRYRLAGGYGNVIQGLVAGGAAVLIFVIGLRGLKFIPSEEPSLILMSLSLEFILLIVLMFTFAGSPQEERLDRVVKELEAEQRDAIHSQTETLQEIFDRMRSDVTRKTDGESIADFEERRLLDEVVNVLLKKTGTGGGRNDS